MISKVGCTRPSFEPQVLILGRCATCGSLAGKGKWSKCALLELVHASVLLLFLCPGTQLSHGWL